MIDVLGTVRDRLGESPLWSVVDQALWWVDIEGRALRRYDWATRTIATWDTAERPGSIALHARGGLLAAMESGLFHLRPHADGRLDAQRVASVSHARADMRFNDGRCDRAGRFWAGTMVRDTSLAAAAGALYRFDARGLSEPIVEGLIIVNGIAFSPDGCTMYLADGHASVRRIWRFDLTPDGAPVNRREFVDLNQHCGRPDGAAVDTDGGYWICAADAGQVLRFTPEGHLDRSIDVPVSKPTMCSFGGPDMQSLFITSLTRPPEPPHGNDALAGAVFVTRPGATGIAETPFNP